MSDNSIKIVTDSISLSTQGYTDIIDISGQVQDKIEQHKFIEGNLTLFVVGSTGALSCVEYEPGLVKEDLPRMFDSLAPYGAHYGHHNTWGDDNGAAHVRATLMGSSLCVPFKNSKLILGTWQQIIFLDFDTKARERTIVCQIIGK